jgi:hypothetical protein
LRNGGTDDWSGRKQTAKRMKMVFRKPDRIEAKILCIPRLLYDATQALASFCASAR